MSSSPFVHVSRLAGALVLSAVLSLAPRLVHAGGCTPCNSSAECGGGAGVCVEWLGTPPCSGLQRSCCPGQACALMGSTPGCVALGTCRVVTGPSDAGAGDAGASDDAATASDTGAAGDAGDGGTGTMAHGGCGCAVPGRDTRSRGATALLGAALAAAVMIARRHRRGTPRARRARAEFEATLRRRYS